MDKDIKWLLITYYCPVYGDSVRLEPVELERKEITKIFLKKKKVL